MRRYGAVGGCVQGGFRWRSAARRLPWDHPLTPAGSPMNPQAFVQKWKAASDLSERATRQSHFNDLCVLLGEPARG